MSLSPRKAQTDNAIDIMIDSTGLKVYRAGQCLEDKHGKTGKKSARCYRKLHLAMDSRGKVLAMILTDQQADDPSQVKPLLDQMTDPIRGVRVEGSMIGALSIALSSSIAQKRQ